MTLDPSSLASLPPAIWIAFGLGPFFGTGAVFHRLGISLFSRLVFPVLVVFGFATAATYVEIPGIDFDLAEYLPSLRGLEFDLVKAFIAGLGLAAILRLFWQHALIRQGEAGERNTKRWRSARGLYYETAIRLGVLTANADGNAEAREFEALENVFELNAFNAPNARKLYAQQLQTPKPMSRVLAPFKRHYPPASPPCETLILGMATIAAADETASKDELGLIRMAASLLGLSLADTDRLLDAAGIGDAADARRETRAKHLAVLGLGEDATEKQIKKAYKRLASKYAPKKLLLLALPDAERARADLLKAQLDAAYEALTIAA
ncbi:MAG: TerB family tellurite resistance protein [Hyphomonadaceae bacterium]